MRSPPKRPAEPDELGPPAVGGSAVGRPRQALGLTAALLVLQRRISVPHRIQTQHRRPEDKVSQRDQKTVDVVGLSSSTLEAHLIKVSAVADQAARGRTVESRTESTPQGTLRGVRRSTCGAGARPVGAGWGRTGLVPDRVSAGRRAGH